VEEFILLLFVVSSHHFRHDGCLRRGKAFKYDLIGIVALNKFLRYL
jgi:hypothetical protein